MRRPVWAAPDEVLLEGVSAPQWANDYLFLAQPPVGTPLGLRYPLKESILTLSARVQPQPIRLRLRGDSPLAMDIFGTDLPFFEPFEPATDES